MSRSVSFGAQGATRHRLLLQWLILLGVLAFVFVVLWDQGLLATVLTYDRSRISLVIMVVFVLATGHAAYRIYRLSVELDAASSIAELLERHRHAVLSLEEGPAIALDGRALPRCLLTTHTVALLRRHAESEGHTSAEQGLLLATLEKRVKGAHEIGWMVADLMLKLGLLGTVVGFILMLGSVNAIEAADAQSMQAMLTGMSSGMRVALFTTLSGLVAGMLLALQYHLVDRGADEVVASISEISETHLAPRIARLEADRSAAGERDA